MKTATTALLGLGLAGIASAQATTTVIRTIGIDYDAYGQVIRETVEPNDPALRTATEYARDATYGVVTSRTLAWHDPATATDKTRVVETLGYDVRKRFATAVTNARNHSESRSFDEGTGNQISLTGPNQLTTTWQYDGWGRKTRESRADGTSTSFAYRKCIDTCLNSAVSVVVTQDWSGTSQTTVPAERFTDTLGRDVLTRTWSFNGSAVLSERVFNSLGRLSQTAPARFATASSVWTYFDHDAIGRVTQERAPNATGSGYDTTTLSYNGLSSTRTNAKSQTRVEIRNGLGKLKSVADAANRVTTYLYDPFGNLTRTTDPTGNQINVAYDRLGRKTQLTDPDLGTWSYSVDPLGQTWRQVDAKGQSTTYTFDELGRMTRRLEPDLDSYWVYDTATSGVGKLAEAYTWAFNAKDYQRLHAYDSVGRPASTTIRLDWDYVEERGYDAFGRHSASTHRRNAKGGSGGPFNTFTSVYNAQGYRAQITRSDGSSTNSVWSALAQDARGRITQEQLGNGLVTRRGYNAYTARLESIASGPDSNSATHQNDSYAYDSLGNLSSRSHLVSTGGALMSESFGYDSLNRLAASQVSSQSAKAYDYDPTGNLTSKSAVGSYAYPLYGAGSVRPHAVSAIAGTVAGVANPSFTYDANGNLVDGLNRRYAWSSFNQAGAIDVISGGSATQRTAFIFGPEHQRIRQTVSPMSGGVPGAATRTIYHGGAIEKELDVGTNATIVRTYLPMGLGYVEERLTGTAVAASASAARSARYFLNDRLGSPIAIVDAGQTVLQRLSYDAWGRRRNPDGSDDASASLGSIANAQDHTGYTGHEQLDQLGLVHMNGRVYDPITGRMVSADPTVPNPTDPQALNRYAYVLNNPLAYVDPSGFSPMGSTTSEPHVPDINTIRSGWQRVEIVGQRPPGANLTTRLVGGGSMFSNTPFGKANRGLNVPVAVRGLMQTAPRFLAAASPVAAAAGIFATVVDIYDTAKQNNEPAAQDALAMQAEMGGLDAGSNAGADSGDKDASTPTGRRGSPMDVPKGTNEPATIGGREYGGHALDQMQGRGVTPTAVEDAIQNGDQASGNKPGRTVHTSQDGKLGVVTEGGKVVTVITR